MSDAAAAMPSTAGALEIRPARAADWPGLWAVLAPIIREGESYALDRDMSEEAARTHWHAPGKSVFVARDPATGEIVGSYYLRANNVGPAAHVSNAGYAVRPNQRGKGVATELCAHSLEEARRQGYRAMQFNLVLASNVRAVRLWQHMGFAIIGTLPGAFLHPRLGYVDAHVMFRSLIDGD